MFKKGFVVCAACFCAVSGFAEVHVAHIFGDGMVLQRNQQNPVWGTADAGERVTVKFAGQSHSVVTSAEGKWKVLLDSMPANATGRMMKIYSFGNLQSEIGNILVGEVWMCTGQSNMQWAVAASNHSELELLSANYPNIRLFSIPLVGAPVPQSEIGTAEWQACTPQSVPDFSAAGYFFGRRLHQILDVPVGLINASWGSSSLETWIPRDAIEAYYPHPEFLADWDWRAEQFTDQMLSDYIKKYEAWEAAGKPGAQMRPARDIRIGQNRPCNAFNGVLNPIVGYGIKGAIWCQGEGNLGRGQQYGDLFPILINSWRELWGQGDFPFYWIQIASMKAEDMVPSESSWAELREGQSKTLSLPNTGEVVSMDIGEGNAIHYRNKQVIGNRLARLALDNAYGYSIEGYGPRFETQEVQDAQILLTFDHVNWGLSAFDFNKVTGFAIAGADKKFVWAEAKIIGKDQVKVWSDHVKDPVAVRYAWSDNPVCNLYDRNGLPVACFRTDKWPVPSDGKIYAQKRYEYKTSKR